VHSDGAEAASRSIERIAAADAIFATARPRVNFGAFGDGCPDAIVWISFGPGPVRTCVVLARIVWAKAQGPIEPFRPEVSVREGENALDYFRRGRHWQTQASTVETMFQGRSTP